MGMRPESIEEMVARLNRALATYEALALLNLSTWERTAAYAWRQLVECIVATPHRVIEDDCWFTCPAATQEHDGGETCNEEQKPGVCKCGRDDRVRRQLELLTTGLRLLVDV